MGFHLVRNPREPLQVFHPPAPDRFYVIGVDVAEGTGCRGADYSAIQVLDVETCWQMAEYHTNTLDPFDIGRKADVLGRFYAGAADQAHIIVESNMHGLCTLSTLRDECLYWNLYSRINPDGRNALQRGIIGFQTNVNTRQHLVDEGRRIFRHMLTQKFCEAQGPPVSSKRLANEMRSFVYNENGKPEAAPGEHDDLVMAWLLAVYGRRTAWLSTPDDIRPQRRRIPIPGSDEWVEQKETQVISEFMEEKGVPWEEGEKPLEIGVWT